MKRKAIVLERGHLMAVHRVLWGNLGVRPKTSIMCVGCGCLIWHGDVCDLFVEYAHVDETHGPVCEYNFYCLDCSPQVLANHNAVKECAVELNVSTNDPKAVKCGRRKVRRGE